MTKEFYMETQKIKTELQKLSMCRVSPSVGYIKTLGFSFFMASLIVPIVLLILLNMK